MTALKDLKTRFMEDSEFREEYAWADDEFTQIEALVHARTAAKLTRRNLHGVLARLSSPSHGWKAAAYRRPSLPCAATPKRPARG